MSEEVQPSAAEFAEIVRDFSDTDWARLRLIAQTFAKWAPITEDDLLQEACFRVLRGTRPYPSDIGPVRFLAGVMKSVASDSRKARQRCPDSHLVLDADDEVIQSHDSSSPEAEAISEQEFSIISQQLLQLFSDDDVAEVMLEGMMIGMDGEELRSLTELDSKGFASKRRLIRRRINGVNLRGTNDDQ